ncbi:hypothetical protein GOODEAATRI_007379 [Goodea atripinnis]|uniref:Uncharacterized protein n=1 Tax=Goodea atripinnis TaxID=208336 RepID=A0ABV0PC93_9TELE
MSYDLHVICEGCLSPGHANLALTLQSTCPSCRRLPPEEKQWWLAIFFPLEGEFPVADQCALEEALDIFDAGWELDDSAPETATDSISTPFLQMEDTEGGATPVQAQGLPIPASPPSHPSVPVLEPSLSAVFGVRSARHIGRWPVPPSSSDQITARLTDRSHQCAAQVAAATNNTAFLAYSISKKAREMELLPEDVEEFCNFADTILNICAALAVCCSGIAAWQILLQRQMWLRLSSSIPEDFKRELLEGPISLDGLFDSDLRSNVVLCFN